MAPTRRRRFGSATNSFGTTFLAENGKKDGVVTLPSGLQYKVISKGSGDSHPTVDSPCECHYEGARTASSLAHACPAGPRRRMHAGRTAANFPSGAKFDSSYDRGSPTTFAPNQVRPAAYSAVATPEASRRDCGHR